MAKKNSFFEILNSIFYKTPKNWDKKEYNAYLLSLYLSQDRDLINIVNKINPYVFDLPDKLIYKYFLKAVPKKKRYLKYTTKEKTEKKDQKLIDELMETFDISENEAKLSIKEDISLPF